MGNTKIGEGCVIAVAAVVNKSFESNRVIGGISAKELRLIGEKYE